jgi:uncharacterized small protein (DUF1192 family)
MDTDDLEPPRPKVATRDLDAMSVADLEAYIGELQGEIDRARAKIAAKQAHRSGATALFRKH